LVLIDKKGDEMGAGFLKVQLYIGDYALHGDSITVFIKKDGVIIHTLQTDENGSSEVVTIECPCLKHTDGLNLDEEFFTTVDVDVPKAQGYKAARIYDVQIFDGITSILNVHLEPIVPGDSIEVNETYVPKEHGVDIDRDNGSPDNYESGDDSNDTVSVFESDEHQSLAPMRMDPLPMDPMVTDPLSMNPESYAANIQRNAGVISPINVPLANEVVVPDFITVHLGTPNAAARNVRVPFKEYIINVVCSEIYPFWEVAAIEANTHAIVSFTLNRLFTHWYRSRGHAFDITNNIQFDQFFVYGREIFQNVALIVDRIFNQFIRRPGRREPFFASYCNGTTSTCAGMSQHGTQALARQGFTPIQILRHYYPNDITIVQSTNFGPRNPGAYPGTALRQGSTGDNVRLLQIYLNRISGNWWIPAIQNPNGIFGADTHATVVAFQRLFNLVPDGVVGPITWYEIIRIYVAARNLAELISEGQRYSIGNTPPTVVIRQGARGEAVVELQFLLNFIAEFYNDLPFVVEDGVFRDSTRLAVIDFQRRFGLNPDGIVGPLTWNRLYEVYRRLRNTVPLPPPSSNIPPFPGIPLQVGSQGDNVRLMQTYLNAIARTHPSIGTLVVDGIYGPRTQAAVREFQRIFGLTQDGIIGRDTWYRIVDEFNLLQNTPTPPPPPLPPPPPPPPPPPTGPPFPGTSLRVGSRGENVRTMQRMLNNIARVYPIIPGNLTEDGIFGPITEASVRAFQTFFGLTADGIIGPITWGRIVDVNANLPNITAPRFQGNLQVGSRGDNVRILQQHLNDLVPFYPTIARLNVDGAFGPITQGSVMAFQRAFGMAANGIVTQTVWNLLVSMRNLLAPGSAGRTVPTFATSAGFETFEPERESNMGYSDVDIDNEFSHEPFDQSSWNANTSDTIPDFAPQQQNKPPMSQGVDKLALMLALMLLREK